MKFLFIIPGLSLILTTAGFTQGKSDTWIYDHHGAVIRGELAHKQIALVFTGHEFSEGGEIIRETLKKNRVPASFFFTGDFYRNPENKALIQNLISDGHYMGAHSDKHLQYVHQENRDSLALSFEEFKHDLNNNYKHMAHLGIKKADALFFMPPLQGYNSSIVRWTNDMGLHLTSFSPGTLSHYDHTHPEMGEQYKSSDEIYESILKYESSETHAMKGFILVLHIGTDPRRTDKFYHRLESLLAVLDHRGYSFVEINELLD